MRVERVQDISEEDAKAEGIEPDWCDHSRIACEEIGCLGPWRIPFGDAWDALNQKRGFGWEANPWVWAITFRRLEANDDER